MSSSTWLNYSLTTWKQRGESARKERYPELENGGARHIKLAAVFLVICGGCRGTPPKQSKVAAGMSGSGDNRAQAVWGKGMVAI